MTVKEPWPDEMLHGTAVAILLRWNWQWTADPKTIPGSPIADQSNGLKRGVPSPPQSGWRMVSEEMAGAEVIHTFVATMTEHQQRHCLVAQSPLGATRFCLAGSQAAAVPICRD
jgi:hypothetical protein